VRGLEQAHGIQSRCVLRLEDDCPHTIPALWNLAQRPQQICCRSKRHNSLGLIPDNAKSGQLAETIRSLGHEARTVLAISLEARSIS
jgi:hypothetical protein